MSPLNLKRVLLYAGLAVLATGVAGFVPGFIRGLSASRGLAPPTWTDTLQAILVPLALGLVFVRLAQVQRERTWPHAAAVWGITSIVSAANLAVGLPPVQFLAGAVVSAVIAAVGVAVGVRLPAPRRGAGRATDGSAERLDAASPDAARPDAE